MSDEEIDPPSREEILDRLESRLGYRFEHRALLRNALRHASYAHEKSKGEDASVENNERLEFLGDAVLGLVVADSLFRAHPDWREGDLSRTCHALVDGRSLARLARGFELGSVIRLGRTEQQSGGEDKASILEDVMEAIVGAIYLDGGLEAATRFVESAFGEDLVELGRPVRRDPKSEFQERVMAFEGEFPRYRVIADNAIEGDDERFTVEVFVRDRPLAQGVGRTKRAAERRAARHALETWRAEHPEAG